MLRQSSPPLAAAELRQEGLFVPRAVTATGQAVRSKKKRVRAALEGHVTVDAVYAKQVVQTNQAMD